jgi:hypothetical protein
MLKFIPTTEAEMRTLYLWLALLLILPHIAAQNNEDVVRLPPNALGISGNDDGKIVELFNSASVLNLPPKPPAENPIRGPWFVDVRNLGPKDVTIKGINGFTVIIHRNDFVRIRAIGNVYVFAGRPKT